MCQTDACGNAKMLSLPSDRRIFFKARSTSGTPQRITITSGSQKLFQAAGSGEEKIIGQSFVSTDSALTVQCEYLHDGQWRMSDLRVSGPYLIGSYNLLVVSAKSGKDADCNDSAIDISWFTPKS